jgi:hypothetical protein
MASEAGSYITGKAITVDGAAGTALCGAIVTCVFLSEPVFRAGPVPAPVPVPVEEARPDFFRIRRDAQGTGDRSRRDGGDGRSRVCQSRAPRNRRPERDRSQPEVEQTIEQCVSRRLTPPGVHAHGSRTKA